MTKTKEIKKKMIKIRLHQAILRVEVAVVVEVVQLSLQREN